MNEWQPTLELRRFDDTGKLTNPRLQQRWCRVIGFEPAEYEWRDVPLVWEPAGRTSDVLLRSAVWPVWVATGWPGGSPLPMD